MAEGDSAWGGAERAMEGFACARNRRRGEDGADIAYGSARIREHLLLSETGTVGRRGTFLEVAAWAADWSGGDGR